METITAQPVVESTVTKPASVVATRPAAPTLVPEVAATPSPRKSAERVALTMMLLGCGAFVAAFAAYVLFPAVASLLSSSSMWTPSGP